MTFPPPQNQPQTPSGWGQNPPPGGAVPPGPGAPGVYAAPGAPGVPGPPPAPKNNSTKWIVGGLATFLVVSLVAIGGIFLLTNKKSAPAGDTVKAYLQALAAGDANKALSFGAGEPGSKELLTNEVLKKQIAKAPITDIRILEDQTTKSSISFGSVHVSVKFGSKTSDETLYMKKKDGKWKLDNAAVKLKVSSVGGRTQAYTVMGKQLTDNDTTLYLFPGWAGIAPLNPNFSVNTDVIFGLKDLSYANLSSSDVKPNVSPAGIAAAEKAIRDRIAECVQSKEAAPANCPNKLRGSNAASVSWKMPALTPTTFKDYTFYEYKLSLTYYSVDLVFPYTAGPEAGESKAYSIIEADLTKSPPAISFDR
ncbi:MAG: hypothetical protein QM728_08410 [Gordonia sp. (in: high G+C Gram-positive bacteria)]|uniref:hypothetical protein n=1 Tax=Gordonia sp. (in: high G+C Gram-positive bacteria) TaxID=84139 RepID=UPI0039E53E7F